MKNLVLMLFMLFIPLSFQPVFAEETPLCNQAEYQQTEFCKNQSSGNNNPILSTLNTVIDLVAVLGSIAAVIMIIIGGLRYVTSSGDPQTASSARHTILYSLVGLVVIIFARFVVTFVLGRIG